ncbi:MAG: hypothetical protein OHK0013_31950 [Sandaracinaceae bacterium]
MSRAFPTLLSLFAITLGVGCGSAGQDAAEATLLASSDPQPAARAAAPRDDLDAESRAALARVPFRVLLLPARWSPRVMSTEGQRWVAQTAHADGIHLSLHGTDVEHPDLRDGEVENLPVPSTLVRGVPAWVTLNEQIRAVSFHDGAVAWSLEVECDRPLDDTRCTEPGFALDLAEQLEAVEPQTAGGGAR